MEQTFAGFLMRARRWSDGAKALSLYVKRRTDRYEDVMDRVRAAKASGAIGAEYYDRLKLAGAGCLDEWRDRSKLLDTTDPQEWRALGGGGRVRVTRIGPDVDAGDIPGWPVPAEG